MRPRRKSALLWGIVGALSFLVLAQGFRLYADDGIGLLSALVVAVGVGLVTAAGSYFVERRVG